MCHADFSTELGSRSDMNLHLETQSSHSLLVCNATDSARGKVISVVNVQCMLVYLRFMLVFVMLRTLRNNKDTERWPLLRMNIYFQLTVCLTKQSV